MVGPEPSNVIASSGSVWVANDIGVSRLDPATARIVTSLTVGGEADVAASGDQLWIDSYASDTVGQVDVGTNRVIRTTKIAAPTAIAVGEGAVWVMSLRDGLMARLNPQTAKVVATIPVDGALRRFPVASIGPRSGPGIAVGLGAVWAVVPFSGELVRVDPSSNRSRTFKVGGQPVGVAVFGDSVWVIESTPHAILRIDPAMGRVSARIALPSQPLGVGIGLSSVWVSGRDMLGSIDPATNQLSVRSLGGVGSGGVAEAGGKLWVSASIGPSDLSNPGLAFFDPSDQRVLGIDPLATDGEASPPAPIEPLPGTLPVTITQDVAFTPSPCEPCRQMLDVYAPTRAGSWPVVVLVHGGPCGTGCRDYLTKQASVLALEGIVVFNADYRDGDVPGVQRRDIACAISFARSTASQYGGDPSRVTLVGHSNGAYEGIFVALLGDSFHEPCLGTSASSAPDAFVGIAGGRPDAGVVAGLGANPHLVVRLVIGTNDNHVPLDDPQRLQEALRKSGYDSTFTEVRSANHFTVLDPGSASPTFTIIRRLVD
ncbi:MAG: carboxylesterase family protein [Actinomycetota bacterium]